MDTPNVAPGPMARWIKILEAFTIQDQWGVRELASATGLSATSAHRILHEMTRSDLLTAGMARGQFRVGPELTRLAVLLSERLDVRRTARPILQETAETIGETVILTAYSPTRRAFWAVDAAESQHTISYVWESLRPWNDLTRGASGKGILAFLPTDDQEAVLATVDDPERETLRLALQVAREEGYVISHGERFAGAVGVSAPLFDAAARVIGDVVAGWPDNRTSPDKERRVAVAVTAASMRISRMLGYQAPAPASGRQTLREP